MRSQQAATSKNLAMRRAWVLLFLVAWALGQALALGHRLVHAPHGVGPHAAWPAVGAQGGPGPEACDGHGHGHPHGHVHEHGHPPQANVASLVGGEHHDGESVCRLVDQLGLGEALLLAVLPPAAAPPAAARVPTPGLPARRPAQRQPYDARAPPLG